MGTTFAWSPDVVSMLTHWALPFLVVLGVLVAFHEAGISWPHAGSASRC